MTCCCSADKRDNDTHQPRTVLQRQHEITVSSNTYAINVNKRNKLLKNVNIHKQNTKYSQEMCQINSTEPFVLFNKKF